MKQYFSDHERGAVPRTKDEISDELWGGIVGLIGTELNKQSFAIDFPEECPDGGSICGTDQNRLKLILKSEIPQIEWPITPELKPDKLAIFDLIQFFFHHISNANPEHYHGFFKHHHFTFNRQDGKNQFIESINRLFARNGIAYDLNDSGDISRIGSPIFQDILDKAIYNTGDKTLNFLLSDARSKFTNPDVNIRKEGLEKLWDVWERIKTIETGLDKRESIKKIWLLTRICAPNWAFPIPQDSA